MPLRYKELFEYTYKPNLLFYLFISLRFSYFILCVQQHTSRSL